jgi:hypothetical protein
MASSAGLCELSAGLQCVYAVNDLHILPDRSHQSDIRFLASLCLTHQNVVAVPGRSYLWAEKFGRPRCTTRVLDQEFAYSRPTDGSKLVYRLRQQQFLLHGHEVDRSHVGRRRRCHYERKKCNNWRSTTVVCFVRAKVRVAPGLHNVVLSRLYKSSNVQRGL